MRRSAGGNSSTTITVGTGAEGSLSTHCDTCDGPGLFGVEQNGRSRRLLCDRCTGRALAGLDPIIALFFERWLPLRDADLSRPDDLPDETRCPACGTTFAEVEQTGRLGCGACYKAFEKAVMPALRILHSGEGDQIGH
jgi:hypothetical protein